MAMEQASGQPLKARIALLRVPVSAFGDAAWMYQY
jgi:hypothetical protein